MNADKKQEVYEKQMEDYRKMLETGFLKNHEFFQTQTVYLAGGSLAFTITIVEKLVKNLTAMQFKWMLLICWSAFVLSLIVNLASNFYGAKVYERALADLAEQVDDTLMRDNLRKGNACINLLNKWAVICLILGIIFFTIFIGLNIL